MKRGSVKERARELEAQQAQQAHQQEKQAATPEPRPARRGGSVTQIAKQIEDRSITPERPDVTPPKDTSPTLRLQRRGGSVNQCHLCGE